MQDAANITSTLTIGTDLSRRYSQYCVLDEGGSVVEEGRLATRPAAPLPRAPQGQVGGRGRSALADSAVRREPDHERRDDQRRRAQPPTGLSMEAGCHVSISAFVSGRAP